jgi:hypothetical protein
VSDAAAQLHPRCKITATPLHRHLPNYGKKWFSGKGLECVFCLRKGHEVAFCPAKPYEPPLRFIVPFVEKLLTVPMVNSSIFEGLSLAEGAKLVMEMGEKLNEGNPWKGSTRAFDQLRAQLGYWKAIGSNNAVISWLGYGVPMRFIKEPPYLAFPNHECDEPEMVAFVKKDMIENIAGGFFIRAPPGSVKVSNPILCIQRPIDGKCRRCDDCRHCNAYQACPRFTMDSVKRDVPNLVKPDDEVQLTKDLEKAYYKVPLAEEFWGYAGTFWVGIFYLAVVMLFGMCQAPFYFTKICRPIARLFGALRCPVLNYIDDWFWSMTLSKLKGVKLFIRLIFGLLGWTFNDKGEEGTAVKLLGFIIDSVRREFVVPLERANAVGNALREFALAAASHKPIQRKLLQKAMGSVISMSLAIPGVRVWSRALYAHTNTTSTTVMVSAPAQKELGMLMFLIKFHNGSPFLDPTHDISMWVDSGEIGWGASAGGVEVQGHFTAREIGTSSTRRELMGLTLALRHPQLREQVTDRTVALHMDSMCSVRNLINGGGPVPELVVLIQELWLICEEYGTHLLPIWQRRSESMMQRVDVLSKENTFWDIHDTFRVFIQQSTGLEVWAPDLARCGPVIGAIVARQTHIMLALPRWEAKSWWNVALSSCSSWAPAPPCSELFVSNDMGLPMWDFCLFTFTP